MQQGEGLETGQVHRHIPVAHEDGTTLVDLVQSCCFLYFWWTGNVQCLWWIGIVRSPWRHFDTRTWRHSTWVHLGGMAGRIRNLTSSIHRVGNIQAPYLKSELPAEMRMGRLEMWFWKLKTDHYPEVQGSKDSHQSGFLILLTIRVVLSVQLGLLRLALSRRIEDKVKHYLASFVQRT